MHSDVANMRYEDLKEEAARKPLEFFELHSIDVPPPTDKQLTTHLASGLVYDRLADLKALSPEEQWSEIGDEPEVPDHEIKKVADEEATRQLKDPVAHLTDMFGDEDGLKEAIEIGGIDTQAAAEEAVSSDGAAHFLSLYDGYTHELPGGIVYWREN